MQITIIGNFNSGSGGNSSIGTDFYLSDRSAVISWVANARQVVEELDSGSVADLLICGSEINVDELTESLLALGITVPIIIQPKATPASEYVENSQMVGTRLSSENDPSGWLGNEKDPVRIGQRLCDMERALILQTLTHCGGNRTYAADILGISSRTLRTKLQQYSAEGCTVKAANPRQSPIATHAPTGTLLS